MSRNVKTRGLSKTIKSTQFHLKLVQKSGAPGGTRTHDPLLRRQMLYPAELPEHVLQIGNQFNNIPHKRQKINPLSNKNRVLPRISHKNNQSRNHYMQAQHDGREDAELRLRLYRMLWPRPSCGNGATAGNNMRSMHDIGS